MSWNYRVVKHVDPKGCEYFGLHEVHYDKRGRVILWTEEPAEVGTTLAELLGTIERQGAAVLMAISNNAQVLDEKGLPKDDEI